MELNKKENEDENNIEDNEAKNKLYLLENKYNEIFEGKLEKEKELNELLYKIKEYSKELNEKSIKLEEINSENISIKNKNNILKEKKKEKNNKKDKLKMKMNEYIEIEINNNLEENTYKIDYDNNVLDEELMYQKINDLKMKINDLNNQIDSLKNYNNKLYIDCGQYQLMIQNLMCQNFIQNNLNNIININNNSQNDNLVKYIMFQFEIGKKCSIKAIDICRLKDLYYKAFTQINIDEYSNINNLKFSYNSKDITNHFLKNDFFGSLNLPNFGIIMVMKLNNFSN